MELVDLRDLKSLVHYGRVGSNPTLPTTYQRHTTLKGLEMGKEVKKILGLVALLFIVILGIMAGFGGYHIVPPGHRGIVVTLGSVHETFRGEGLTFKCPFATTIVNTPIKQITASGKAISFSSDLQTVMIAYNVLYRIPEGQVVTLYQKYQGDPYDTLVRPRVQEILKKVAATYRAEDIVKARDKIKVQAIPFLQEAIGDRLFIVDVVIINIDLTDELEKSIEKKQIIEQEALAKVYELLKLKQYASKVKLLNQVQRLSNLKLQRSGTA